MIIGMCFGAIFFVGFACWAAYPEPNYYVIVLSLMFGIFFFTGIRWAQVMHSPVCLDVEGIWNQVRGQRVNYCRWSDLTRVSNGPGYSVSRPEDTETWMLYAKSGRKKTKLVFDNNIEDYAELASLVEEQVERRGIKIEGR